MILVPVINKTGMDDVGVMASLVAIAEVNRFFYG